jgi:hypothetical protein
MTPPEAKRTGYLNVRALSVIITLSSLLCGAAYFGRDHVSIELGVWCWYWEVFGPIFGLLLSGLLLVAFFRTGGQQRFMFGLGMIFGLAVFAVWAYARFHE